MVINNDTKLNNQFNASDPFLSRNLSIKNFSHPNVYLGPDYTNVPGISNLIFTPSDAYQSGLATFRAIDIGDKEGIVENGLRICASPFNLINASSQLTWYVIQAGLYLKTFSSSIAGALKPLSLSVSVAGFIFSAIEGVLEVLGIFRSTKFLFDYQLTDLKELKDALAIQDPAIRDQTFYMVLQRLKNKLPDNLKFEIESRIIEKKPFASLDEIQEFIDKLEASLYQNCFKQLYSDYYQISTEEHKKIDQYVQKHLSHLSIEEKCDRTKAIIATQIEKKQTYLIRRIHNRLAKELKEVLPALILDLQSSVLAKRVEAKERAARLFDDFQIQSYKKLWVHTIGILAVAFTILGLALGFTACPYLIPIILLVVGGVLSMARYQFNLGFKDTKGWEFSGESCVPDWIKSIRKRFSQKSPPPPVIHKLHFEYFMDTSQEGTPKLSFRLASSGIKV